MISPPPRPGKPGILTGTVEKMGFVGAVIFLIFMSGLFGFGWTMGMLAARFLFHQTP